MRKFVVLIVLLLAALLGWFALRRGPAGAESLGPALAQSALDTAAAHPLDPVPDERASSLRAAGNLVAEEPQARAGADAPTERIELRGTIIAIDEKGVEHVEENGTFELISWKGQGGHGQELEVRRGAWSARVARGVELGAHSIELGGRTAVLEGDTEMHDERLPIPADGVVALRVRWLRGLRLLVRDRDTNLDLAQVTLVRAEGFPRVDLPHPGDVTLARLICSGRTSPIELPAGKEPQLALHAGAPGHAWELCKLDALEGGERVVALGPGGDLEVEIVAERLDKSTELRVRNDLGLVIAEVDVAGRARIAFEGLRCGKVRVSAEIGPWWRDPLVLGSAGEEITAGARARVTLTLARPPEDASTSMAGEVRIAPEWKVERFLLVDELLDRPLGGKEANRRLMSTAMRQDEPRAGVWHWTLDGLQPGRHQLSVWQLQYAIAVDLPAGGREDVVLEPPPPVEVLVRVVDTQRGLEARLDSLAWNCQRPEGVRGGGAQLAQWDEARKLWSFRAPRGPVELHANAQEFQPLTKLVELREGMNEIVLEVARQYAVVLRLSCAGSPVPLVGVAPLKLQPADGGEPSEFWTVGGSAVFNLPFPRPGKWTVTLPEVPGYAPPAPFVVDVAADHIGERSVEFEPKR